MNFAEWLLEGRENSGAIAIVDGEHSVTYASLHELMRRYATIVRTKITHERRVVLVVSENSIDAVAAYLGIFYAGGVPAPLASDPKAALADIIADANPALVFTTGEHAARVTSVVAGQCEVLELSNELGLEAAREPVPFDELSLALLLFTSGSTGRSRGVMLSTRNLVANTSAVLAACPIKEDDIAFDTLPFYFAFGSSVVHTHLRAGAALVFHRFRAPGDLAAAMKHVGATSFFAVPTVFHILFRSPRGESCVPESVSYAMVSGGSLDAKTLGNIAVKNPALRMFVRYGVTELSAAASILDPAFLHAKPGSIGRGLPDAPLAVLRKDGTSVTFGGDEVGEIVGVGANVTLGYFKDDSSTKEHFREGRFHTGDLAKLDSDGFIFVVGREREFIKSSGHRVSPQEIEEVIRSMQGILEAGVFGEAHATYGEVIVAVVVVSNEAPVDASAVCAHCERLLPTYKVPHKIRFVPALPRTPSGKVNRVALKLL